MSSIKNIFVVATGVVEQLSHYDLSPTLCGSNTISIF